MVPRDWRLTCTHQPGLSSAGTLKSLYWWSAQSCTPSANTALSGASIPGTETVGWGKSGTRAPVMTKFLHANALPPAAVDTICSSSLPPVPDMGAWNVWKCLSKCRPAIRSGLVTFTTPPASITYVFKAPSCTEEAKSGSQGPPSMW